MGTQEVVVLTGSVLPAEARAGSGLRAQQPTFRHAQLRGWQASSTVKEVEAG